MTKLLMKFQKETDLVLLTEEVFAKDGFQIRELWLLFASVSIKDYILMLEQSLDALALWQC